MKETAGAELVLADPGIKSDLAKCADYFSEFLYNALTHAKINPEFRRYLLI